MNVNTVTLIGRVANDPELKNFGQDQKLAKFGVATNRTYKDSSSVTFHNVVCFSRLADIANSFLKKGKLVYIQGRLQTSKWKDKQGNHHSRTEIVAQQILLLDKKQALENAGSDQPDNDVPEATLVELSADFERKPQMTTVR